MGSLGVLAVSLVAGSWVQAATAEPAKLEFNKHVRPILAEHCFKCHGADEKARKGKLRLDVREEAMAKKAVLAGDVVHSTLVQRILTSDTDDLMPPVEAHDTLTDGQKNLLKRWIQEGAEYQKHWAFIPSAKPPVPATPGLPSPVSNPIDAFVRAALHERGLTPAAPAGREQWLRRVTFALTGLPPSLDEIGAFHTDDSPAAREKVIDRLLDAPAFGEHFGKDWLDTARYADSYGRHEDGDMVAWPWRDWVIRSFNTNLPYDKFVLWQTAGDLLPQPTRDQLVATAFNRLSPQSNESGNDPVEFRLDQVSDRVRTNGLAFMGLSLECAKCHDHKYDPITQKEYWEMAALFDNIDENGVYSQFCPRAIPSPSLLMPTQGEQQRLDSVREVIRGMEQELARLREAARPEFEKWVVENGLPGTLKDGWWNTVKSWFGGGERIPWKHHALGWFQFEQFGKKFTKSLPNRANQKIPGTLRTRLEQVASPVGKGVLLKGDDEITFAKMGEFHRYEPFSFALWFEPREPRDRQVIVSWARAGLDDGRGYEVVLDKEVPSFALMHFHPGNEIRIRAKAPLPLNVWTHLAVTYDGSSRASGMKMWINGAPADVEVVHDHLKKDIVRRKEWGDIDLNDILFTLGGRYHDSPMKNCAADEFYVFKRTLSAGEVKLLAKQAGATREDWLDWWLQLKSEPWRTASHQLMLLRKREDQVVDDVLEMMVMQELPRPRQFFVRTRGDYRQPADPVQPGTPGQVMPFPEAFPRNRLGYAMWLTSPQHPLTSRVAVNRFWQTVFGRGLVATPQDFGTRGELPTHPELLDWLACDFMQHGWDVKRLVRMMALSETFAQSTMPSDAKTLVGDPENRWLARGSRTRLAAEEVRDQALAVSGLLCPTVGGPSVRSYMPQGLYKDSGLQQIYREDPGDAIYRRSLYSFWRRTLPPPELAAFDAPSREFCMVKREKTSSPLQALMLLNQTQFVEAQRVLAEKLVRELPADAAARCSKAFRLLTSRPPTVAESEVMARMLEKERGFYQANANEAGALRAENGRAPVDANLPPVEVAATTMVVRALMSHDEALNR